MHILTISSQDVYLLRNYFFLLSFFFFFLPPSAQLSISLFLLAEILSWQENEMDLLQFDCFSFSSMYFFDSNLADEWNLSELWKIISPGFWLCYLETKSLEFWNNCVLFCSSWCNEIWSGNENSECGSCHKVPVIWCHSSMERS